LDVFLDEVCVDAQGGGGSFTGGGDDLDRKSTRLNSSHITISYAVFCLKKKNTKKKMNGHNGVDRRSA